LATSIYVTNGNVPGRNPKTGEEIPISARRVVTFKPGQKLKARVDVTMGEEGLMDV
jgi:nucleoid DNA-binding protein